MPPQGAELDIPGVGVRVEVDHRDPTRAEGLSGEPHAKIASGGGTWWLQDAFS